FLLRIMPLPAIRHRTLLPVPRFRRSPRRHTASSSPRARARTPSPTGPMLRSTRSTRRPVALASVLAAAALAVALSLTSWLNSTTDVLGYVVGGGIAAGYGRFEA